MELFLWLYFYDERWFFNLKLPIHVYRNIWFIPLIYHFFLASISLYYINLNEDPFQCEDSLKVWIYQRIFFSLLLILCIILFKVKIKQTFSKELKHYSEAKKIYPILNQNCNLKYNYWIKQNSLISTSGILLLFLGFISLFWSYLIFKMFFYNPYYNNCNLKIQQLLFIHACIILYGNLLTILILILSIFIKISSNIAAFTCPDLLIKLSKLTKFKGKGDNLIKMNYIQKNYCLETYSVIR